MYAIRSYYVQARLGQADVHVSVRGRVIRVAPHIYNDEAGYRQRNNFV